MRLVSATFHRSADMRCQADVCLEWSGTEYRATQTGVGRGPIDHRVAAEATLEALRLVLRGGVSVRLVGTKAVRAFDHDIVIVSVAVREPNTAAERSVIGASLIHGGEMARGVARAILNATNRRLANSLEALT
ncbi:MAG: hypothetical protein HY702_04220 [Gemmatimonadetes bacterium]|nr:hypothetical protein [Gemmatimonadota bacterium]